MSSTAPEGATADREPILGINPYDSSYDEVSRAIDSQGWLIAATLLEEPAAFRHSELGDEQVTVYLSNYEAGRVLHLSYGLTAKDGSDETLAHLEAEYRRLCEGFEALLGPGLKSGTGPVIGCYWTGGATDSYVEYHPPGEDGPQLSVEIFFD
ncbi:MAG TPA: hypothetical protein VM054_08255 [bacterium]|nr:hypothetical protein [bacterium]